MSRNEVHVNFAGKIVVVGFGSIGQGVLPLILRHIGTSPDRITIVTAENSGRTEAEQFGVKFVQTALTRENYRSVLEPRLDAGDFLLNLSVDVSSVALVVKLHTNGLSNGLPFRSVTPEMVAVNRVLGARLLDGAKVAMLLTIS